MAVAIHPILVAGVAEKVSVDGAHTRKEFLKV